MGQLLHQDKKEHLLSHSQQLTNYLTVNCEKKTEYLDKAHTFFKSKLYFVNLFVSILHYTVIPVEIL